MTRILPAGSPEGLSEAAREAASLLRAGELVVYPTDTFYALGADPYDEGAVERVFRLKGRSPARPLPMILSDEADLAELGIEPTEVARLLTRAFWPGPLTLSFPAPSCFPTAPLAGSGTVAVRVPACAIARRIAAETCRPIVATSANLASGEPARTVQEAEASFGERVALYVDGGALTRTEAASTLLDLSVHPPRLLREGAVPREAIEKIVRLAK